MTVKTERMRNNYVGTNLLSDYDYKYTIEDSSWLTVKILTISTGAIVILALSNADGFKILSGVGDVGGGQIQLTASSSPRLLTTDEQLAVIRDVPNDQQSAIRNQGDSFPDRVENAFDFRTYVDQQLEDALNLSLKVDSVINTSESLDPNFVDMTLPAPEALMLVRWNAAANGWENTSVADLGAIGLPGSNGIAVYVGSNTFTARTFQTTGDISMTDPDGIAGNPTIISTTIDNKIIANTAATVVVQDRVDVLEEQLIGFEQDTPDNTVFTTAGQVNDTDDPTASPTDVDADDASGVTFPVTTGGNSRIDLLVVDRLTGAWSRVAGVDAGSPTVPTYPTGSSWVRAEITIVDTGTVEILNTHIRNVKVYLDYSANTTPAVRSESGSYTGNAANNRTITTSIPGGSTLIRVTIARTDASGSHNRWELAWIDHIDGNSVIANANTSFIPSGINFIVGGSGPNNSGQTFSWIAYYR